MRTTKLQTGEKWIDAERHNKATVYELFTCLFFDVLFASANNFDYLLVMQKRPANWVIFLYSH